MLIYKRLQNSYKSNNRGAFVVICSVPIVALFYYILALFATFAFVLYL